MADEAELWFPEGYGQETADLICEKLADGQSLRSICREEGMPHTATVCRWLARNAPFSEQYARARELQADALFDDCLALSDKEHPKSADDVQERKLQIETRKWMAGKLKGKYSEKTVHEHGGIDGAPIKFGGLELTIVDPKAPA